jgi:hypothetical protein
MSSSPFVPPVPPPTVPDFSANSGLPLPPDAQPVDMPPPVQPEPIVPLEPALSNGVPEGNAFASNNQVMPDQVYPQAAQNTDIGEYRIPGT